MAKKKAKKKVIKKRKKAKRKKRAVKVWASLLGRKRLQIMRDVPTMPCSAVSHDHAGRLFCHTRAEEVFEVYRQQCQKHNITMTVEELDVTDSKRESRAKLKLTLRDEESGEAISCWASGKGDNDVWSDNSAQTIAVKQALLMLFFTAWPQPEDTAGIMKNYLRGVSTAALRQLLGEFYTKVTLGRRKEPE